MVNPIQHQLYQPFPRLGTPIAERDGAITIPWYRFLISLWQRSGGSGGASTQLLYLQELPGGEFGVFNSQTGEQVGTLISGTVKAEPPHVINIVTSPQTVAAAANGTLFVDSGQVEVARGMGGTFYTVGLAGGAVPVLIGDQVRITWYNTPPVAAMFPQTLQ